MRTIIPEKGGVPVKGRARLLALCHEVITDTDHGLDFLPVEKVVRYTPSPEHVDKDIAAADPETRDYL